MRTSERSSLPTNAHGMRPRGMSRRDLLRMSTGAAGALLLAPLAGCGQPGLESVPAPGGPASAQAGSLRLLSTQLAPAREAHTMRSVVLADFDREVDVAGVDEKSFFAHFEEDGEQVAAVLGGTHGDLAALVERDLLLDLSDVVEELGDRGFDPDLLELATYGRDGVYFIPWMEATYVMVARQEALDYLPAGASLGSLTYEAVCDWAHAIRLDTGINPIGLPAGDGGLAHRFVQGYAYPSFTGALNTAFAGEAAQSMWYQTRVLCGYVNVASLEHGFLQDALLTGDVWIGWDHVARIADALRAYPDDFVTFPAPLGPFGRGSTRVVVGLAVPRTSPDRDGATALIDYLTREDARTKTLSEIGFLPPTKPGTADPAGSTWVSGSLETVTAQHTSGLTVPSLLPVGLGEHSRAYNEVFRRTFARIALRGEDVPAVLEDEAGHLQSVLAAAKVACWSPDPAGDGACVVS